MKTFATEEKCGANENLYAFFALFGTNYLYNILLIVYITFWVWPFVILPMSENFLYQPLTGPEKKATRLTISRLHIEKKLGLVGHIFRGENGIDRALLLHR